MKDSINLCCYFVADTHLLYGGKGLELPSHLQRYFQGFRNRSCRPQEFRSACLDFPVCRSMLHSQSESQATLPQLENPGFSHLQRHAWGLRLMAHLCKWENSRVSCLHRCTPILVPHQGPNSGGQWAMSVLLNEANQLMRPGIVDPLHLAMSVYSLKEKRRTYTNDWASTYHLVRLVTRYLYIPILGVCEYPEAHQTQNRI